MVWRIRKMLRLQTKSATMRVDLGTLPVNRPVEKVAAIELNAWFSGPDFHVSTGFPIVNAGGQHQTVLPSPVENPVMIVAFPEL